MTTLYIFHFLSGAFCSSRPALNTLAIILLLLLLLNHFTTNTLSYFFCLLSFSSGLLSHHHTRLSFHFTVQFFSHQLSAGHNCLVQITSLPKHNGKLYRLRTQVLMCGTWQPKYPIYITVKIKSRLPNAFTFGDVLYLYVLESNFIEPTFIYQTQPNRVHGSKNLTDLFFHKMSSVISISHANFWNTPALSIKHFVLNLFLSHYPNLLQHPYSAFTLALLFAEQSFISFSQWNILRITAISHLVAISGLHISILGSLFESVFLLFAMQFNRINPLFASRLMSIVCLFLYACLASFTPSCQRAVSMYVCRHLFERLFLRIHPISNLMLCCLIQYLCDPLVIDHIGFQLSYGIVLSLLVVNHFPFFNHPLKKHLAMFVITNAWSYFYWNQLILIASLTNLIAIFWVSHIILPLSIFCLLLALISFPYSNIFLSLCHFNWQLLFILMHYFSIYFKPISFEL